MSGPHSEKRATILRGASEVFRTEGFDGASMDRVADVAGVSKRTVYNHFGSKDALFAAVIRQLIDAAHALKKVTWNPALGLEEQLLAFARAKTLSVADPNWLGLIRVALGVAITRPDFAKEAMDGATQGEEYLVDWLRSADAAGELEVPNPELAAELFWSMLAGAVFWPKILDTPMSDAMERRGAAEVIETFLSRFRRRDP